ncbi:MAG: hypothetical protein ACYS1A_14650 [Planctomycetota bacterium]|jgi:hypothetical protein
MKEKYFENIINRFGICHTVQAALVSFSVILLTAAVSQIFVPIYSGHTNSQANNISEFTLNENISSLLDENKGKTKEAIAYRPGMFKPATGLQDKPLANKTIERIKKQLKLQCVMEMNGQPVVYINIQGVGLKKCCIGENINDLFTVLNINKQNTSVDISIIEHKITLHL